MWGHSAALLLFGRAPFMAPLSRCASWPRCIPRFQCPFFHFAAPIFPQELKQGYFAKLHAKVATANIKVLAKDKNSAKLKAYKPGQPAGIVSLGRKQAILALPAFSFMGFIPTSLKSKDMFVAFTLKDLGVKVKA